MSTELAAAEALERDRALEDPRTPGRVTVGRTTYVIERPSGRKASTALRLLRRVSGTVKAVTKELGRFEREYRADHAIELDRVQARMRYPEQVIYDADGELMRHPESAGPLAGTPILRSPLDGMTAEDWQRAGHVLKLPVSPSLPEKVGAVIDLALEDAEAELYQVLALFTLTNEEVARAKREQTLDQDLVERADVLVDEGGLEELLELAVVAGETVDRVFARKATELGGRLGNLGRLLGIEPPQEAKTPQGTEEAPQTDQEAPQTDDQEGDLEPPTSTSSSRPTSSSDSASSSDGRPTSPSPPTTASSSPSPSGSTIADDEPRPDA